MDTNQKLLFILEALEVDEIDGISLNTELDEIDEWDSIGILTIISEVDDNFGITLDPEDLDGLETIAQLIKLF